MIKQGKTMVKESQKRRVFIDGGSSDGDTIKIFLEKFSD